MLVNKVIRLWYFSTRWLRLLISDSMYSKSFFLFLAVDTYFRDHWYSFMYDEIVFKFNLQNQIVWLYRLYSKANSRICVYSVGIPVEINFFRKRKAYRNLTIRVLKANLKPKSFFHNRFCLRSILLRFLEVAVFRSKTGFWFHVFI